MAPQAWCVGCCAGWSRAQAAEAGTQPSVSVDELLLTGVETKRQSCIASVTACAACDGSRGLWRLGPREGGRGPRARTGLPTLNLPSLTCPNSDWYALSLLTTDSIAQLSFTHPSLHHHPSVTRLTPPPPSPAMSQRPPLPQTPSSPSWAINNLATPPTSPERYQNAHQAIYGSPPQPSTPHRRPLNALPTPDPSPAQDYVRVPIPAPVQPISHFPASHSSSILVHAGFWQLLSTTGSRFLSTPVAAFPGSLAPDEQGASPPAPYANFESARNGDAMQRKVRKNMIGRPEQFT